MVDRTRGKTLFAQALALLRRDIIEVLDRPDHLLRHALALSVAVVALIALSEAMSQGTHPALPQIDPFLFGLTGLACLDILWQTTIALSARVHRLSHEGLLDLCVTTATSQRRLILLQTLPPSAALTLRLLLYSLLAALLRPTLLSPDSIPLALGLVALGSAALLSIGLLSSAMALLLKRPDPLVWAFVAISGLCAGALLPTVLLPTPLADLANLTPLTPMLEGLRAATLPDQDPDSLSASARSLLAFTALIAPTALLALSLALRKGRIDNSTDHC